MPIYEYRCTRCGHEMSHFHRRRSDPRPPCEECGEDSLEKLISLSSFSLKGDGWYVTDYKSNDGGDSRTADSTTTDSDAGSTTSAESSTTSTKSGTGNSDSSTSSSADAA